MRRDQSRVRACVDCGREFTALEPHQVSCMRCRARLALTAPQKRATVDTPSPLKEQEEEEE